MKTVSELQKMFKILEKVRELTVSDLNLNNSKVDFPQASNIQLDESIITAFNQFSNLEAYWSLNLSNSKIIALNLGADMTFGEVKINVNKTLEAVEKGYCKHESDDIFEYCLQELDIENKFVVVDDLYPNHQIGFVVNDGQISDNLYLLTALDDNLYDLSLSLEEYLNYGYSCGFFSYWQMLFVDSKEYDEKTKKLGYYVPQILPKEIHEPFMQKFKERFREPEDYR